jgi:hypothetical protein
MESRMMRWEEIACLIDIFRACRIGRIEVPSIVLDEATRKPSYGILGLLRLSN